MDTILDPKVRQHGDQESPAAIARSLGPQLAANAAQCDDDRFVAENFALLRQAGLVQAGVPVELGGGGADVDALAAMIRALAYHCGSTGLAFAMHTHQVAIPAWRWRVQKAAPAEPLLKRIAAEQLLLLSSGGSDWIGGSGRAERVAGGYRITARKVFTSGAPTGDLLMTGAILEETGGTVVLHFAVPMSAPEVRLADNWRVLGMRGTGSQDVEIAGYVVPEAAVSLRRPAGKWHPLFEIITTIAFPLVYAAYLGVAESARDIALALGRRRAADRHAVEAAGRMETELAGARMAHESMLAAVRLDAPSAQTVNQVMIGRQLVERHAIAAVEQAMVLAGGAGFYRESGLERRFRDIQAARYHPLQGGPQAEYAGALALGLPVEGIY